MYVTGQIVHIDGNMTAQRLLASIRIFRQIVRIRIIDAQAIYLAVLIGTGRIIVNRHCRRLRGSPILRQRRRHRDGMRPQIFLNPAQYLFLFCPLCQRR